MEVLQMGRVHLDGKKRKLFGKKKKRGEIEENLERKNGEHSGTQPLRTPPPHHRLSFRQLAKE